MKNAAEPHSFPARIVYNCKTHGDIVEVFTFNFDTRRSFCLRCIADKFEELGIIDFVKQQGENNDKSG